jgi:hypothetical protein
MASAGKRKREATKSQSLKKKTKLAIEYDYRTTKSGTTRRRRKGTKHWQATCADCKNAAPKYGHYGDDGVTPKRRWCKPCADKNHPDEYQDFHEKCEDCNASPNYGTYGDDGVTQKRRWCKPCADKNHPDEYQDFTKKCEDCKEAAPTYGTYGDDGVTQKRRWCKPCADKNHPDEYRDFTKKCEDCKEAQPTYGTYGDDGVTPKRRWCKPCTDKNHADEYIDFRAKCTQPRCLKLARVGQFCIRHHPDYIEAHAGCSKIGCEFIDRFSTEMGIQGKVLHKHYTGGSVVGDEHKIEDTNWACDGYIATGVLFENELPIALEFLGDYWHGNPAIYAADKEHPVTKKRMGDILKETMDRLDAIHDLGYRVVYIWESDFNAWKKQAVRSLRSYCTILD